MTSSENGVINTKVRCLWIDPRSTGANPETSEQAIVKAEVTNMCL